MGWEKDIRRGGIRYARGETMTYCPRCGALNEDQATFCIKCGSSMQPPVQPSKRLPSSHLQTSFDRTFKAAGPLIKTFLVTIFLLLVIEISQALSADSHFAESFGDFLSGNLLVFFVIILISSYSGYYSRLYPKEHSFVSPIIAAVVVTFFLWVAANVFIFIGEDSVGNEVLVTMGDVLMSILYIIFLLILLLGYISVIMNLQKAPLPVPPSGPGMAPPASSVPPAEYQPVKRLMRSSRDRIVAGVCGGMAEYFGTDPFLVRVLWVVGLIASLGAFLLAYLVLAIVLPRSP